MKSLLFCCLLATMFHTSFAIAEDKEKAAFTILKQIDDNLRFYDLDLSVKYSILSEKPGKDDELNGGIYFRRDSELKITIVITEPETDKGTGYLWSGENFWAYDPRSRKFIHTSQKDNFKNTDLMNSDFRQYLFTSDYEIVSVSEDTIGTNTAYLVELKGINDSVTYPMLKVWISVDKPIILKREDYGLSKRLMRTVYYPKWTTITGHIFPIKQLFIDEVIKGEKSLLTLEKLSTKEISDDVYTKAYIENVNNR